MWWFTTIIALISPFFQSPDCFEASNSLIILKPDVLQRDLQKKALRDLNRLRIVCREKFTWSRELATEFYQEHQNKTFFFELVESLVGKKSIFITTKSSIEASRNLILQLRKVYAIDSTRNSFHGSDSTESFNRELKLMSG
jgi:nucleoside diphosphate kinase